MGCLRCRHPRTFVEHSHHNCDNHSRNRITQTIDRVIAALILAELSTTVGCTSSSLGSTSPSAAKCQVAVTSANTPIAAAGGTATVSIAAEPECAWTANTDVTWITDLAPAAGQGNSAVQVSAAPNTDPVTRRGMVHIAATDVQITQAAASQAPPPPAPRPPPACTYGISPTSKTFAVTGGTGTVLVTAGAACTWTAVSNKDWIAVTGGSSGSGNGTVTFSAAASDKKNRQGMIRIATETFTVIEKD